VSAEREVKLPVPLGFRMPSFDDGGAPEGGVVAARPGTTERLQTVYYDTEDLRIVRWGCSLRHRGGEGWTVKLPAVESGSAIVRDERVFRGEPSRPPQAAVDLLRAYVRRAPLRPVAKLQTVRTRVELQDSSGESLAELVDDEVSVLEGRRVAARFRELEVEAEDGTAQERLEAIVAELRRAGAGEPTRTPKLLRALGRIAVGPPEVVARDPSPDASAADVITAAIAASVVRLLRNDAGVLLTDDPESVHRARVAVRRLRSHLRSYRSMMDPAWRDPLKEELRWFGGVLGAVRDTEVLEERLRTAATELPDPDSGAASRLLRRLRDRREGARADLLAARESERYLDLLERLVDAATSPPLLEAAAPAAADVVSDVMEPLWHHLTDAIEGIGRDAPDEGLHAARIRAKRARYAAESMAPAIGKRARSFAADAGSLQDVLGEHQDAVVAEAWLRDAASGGGARTAFVAGELAARERRAAARARRRWKKPWKSLSGKRDRFWR
jgi:CHAD domain-containing protein